MPNLVIQIDYTDANPGFFSWLENAIPRFLEPIGLLTSVHVAVAPRQRPVTSFNDSTLFTFTQSIIDNSPLRQQAEEQDSWFVHVFYTTTHVLRHLGLMYDFGFDRRCRQGCAVFAGEIRQITGSEQDHFQRVLLRTTLHEIGHCLNFVHRSDLTLMAQTSDIARRLGSQWIQRISFDYSQAEVDFIRDFPDSCRPGGITSNVGAIVSDTSPFKSKMIKVSVKPFTDKHIKEFEIGDSVSLLVKIENLSEKRITISSPVDNNGDLCKIWLKSPGGKIRLVSKPILRCGIPSDVVEIKAHCFKVFTLHLFADNQGYLFNTPGKYNVAIAVKQGKRLWVKSRSMNFVIKKAKKATGIIRKTVNSTEVLKYMILGSTSNRDVTSKLKRITDDHPLSGFSRAYHWNKVYEIKSKLQLADSQTALNKLAKQMLNTCSILLNAETSKERKGKIVEIYEFASQLLGHKSVSLSPEIVRNKQYYKKFEEFSIKRKK